ncbi:MAG: YraN family protein [Planctomycetes bacterium]|nr:YraN family protein [Planctomycetota bacterium]
MIGNTKQLGTIGEKAAQQFLCALGHKILAKNFTCPLGELDIITQVGNTIVFVEVKSLASDRHDDPESHITPAKQRKLRQVAEFWLAKHRHPECAYRFDAVSVVIADGREPVVRHIPEAFIPRS